MHLTSAQALAMNERSLKEFVALRIPEGPYLDYKVAVSNNFDKDAKREFLKDVSSFANAVGGDLLIGVKEPADGQATTDQIVGLDDGRDLAQSLEQLAAACIDPRIPGLSIVPVELATKRFCFLIHVPPSLSRPHMVSHAGHKSFYIRHSESCAQMTTHEIREAVLTSASAEERARRLVAQRLAEVRERAGDRRAIFIQAAPLIPPDPKWDVLAGSFNGPLTGTARGAKYQYYSFRSHMTRPTIDGLLGRDSNEPLWETEVHRTGYVSLLLWDIPEDDLSNGQKIIALHKNYCEAFRAFCDLLAELWEVAKTDAPYLIACSYLNARGTRLWREAAYRNPLTEPFLKQDLTWPEHLRSTGEDPAVIADNLCLEMFNAFGERKVS
jgi:hypothetical protein